VVLFLSRMPRICQYVTVKIPASSIVLIRLFAYSLNMASRGEIYSTRAESERRTYFFNVKENRRGDVFLSIVESSKKEDGESFERHQVMVYEEDLAGFMTELQKAASIALKGDELKKQQAGPKKYRKKAAATEKAGAKAKPTTKASPADSRPNATNLQRKKVSLKLKKKRREDDA
jgi:hypothetical protein